MARKRDRIQPGRRDETDPPMPPAKKLIEVALPLDAINRARAREKSLRHGHPSTLHLWWARRPLAAARAVIFTSLVDAPDDPDALPAFVAACRALHGDGPNVKREGDTPRMKLFDFIERLVTWEATTDETIMEQACKLVRSRQMWQALDFGNLSARPLHIATLDQLALWFVQPR